MASPVLTLTVEDRQYLDRLYRQLADPRWLSTVDEMRHDTRFTSELLERAIQERDQRALPEPEYRRLLEEALDPAQAYLGTYVSDIRDLALRALGDRAREAGAIPVALLPTGAMNALCIRTPQGGHVILINSGLTGVMNHLLIEFLAFATWRTSQPYSRELSQAEYAERFIRLARFAMSGDPELLVGIAGRPAAPAWLSDWGLSHLSLIIIVFVLSHEYGHALLGHLQSAVPQEMQLPNGARAAGFCHPKHVEFEADAFAVERFPSSPQGSIDFSPRGFALAFLFRLFDFFEAHTDGDVADADRTHPPAIDRWRRAQQQLGIAHTSRTATLDVDGAFDVLLGAAGLTPCANRQSS